LALITKLPPASSLSNEPLPVKVVEAPMSIVFGSKSATFPWVEASPQSFQVTSNVPPVLVVSHGRFFAQYRRMNAILASSSSMDCNTSRANHHQPLQAS
jgi:hypothetical protein